MFKCVLKNKCLYYGTEIVGVDWQSAKDEQIQQLRRYAEFREVVDTTKVFTGVEKVTCKC